MPERRSKEGILLANLVEVDRAFLSHNTGLVSKPQLGIDLSLSQAEFSGLCNTRSLDTLFLRQQVPQIGSCGVYLISGATPGRIAPEGSAPGYSDAWEQDSQPVYGEPYRVVDISADRAAVQIELQTDMRGGNFSSKLWIESHRHYEVSPDIYRLVQDGWAEWPTLANDVQIVPITRNPEGIIRLPQGAKLIFYDKGSATFLGPQFISTFLKLSDSDVFLNNDPSQHSLIRLMLHQLGRPFSWGGKGFEPDCSGFTQLIYNHFIPTRSEQMPRNSGQQALCGGKVSNLTDVKTGDLIQYRGHVGILTKGADLCVHAPELNWDDSSNYIFHAKQRVRVERLDSDGVPRSLYPLYGPKGEPLLTAEQNGLKRRPLMLRRIIDFK
jgi:hypothetical protein